MILQPRVRFTATLLPLSPPPTPPESPKETSLLGSCSWLQVTVTVLPNAVTTGAINNNTLQRGSVHFGAAVKFTKPRASARPQGREDSESDRGTEPLALVVAGTQGSSRATFLSPPSPDITSRAGASVVSSPPGPCAWVRASYSAAPRRPASPGPRGDRCQTRILSGTGLNHPVAAGTDSTNPRSPREGQTPSLRFSPGQVPDAIFPPRPGLSQATQLCQCRALVPASQCRGPSRAP